MMVDDALGIAGRTRCVEQRQGVPLVVGPGPGKVGIALGEERCVIDRAEALTGRSLRVGDFDDEQAAIDLRQRRLDRRGEFGVGKENLRPAVREAEGDRSRVEPVVQRVQDCAQCGHRVMGFEQRRDIGRHQRDGIAAADAAPRQRRSQPSAARLELAIRVRLNPVKHGDLVRPDERAAREKLHRRERDVVRALFA